jgi:hypothetical protein
MHNSGNSLKTVALLGLLSAVLIVGGRRLAGDLGICQLFLLGQDRPRDERRATAHCLPLPLLTVAARQSHPASEPRL